MVRARLIPIGLVATVAATLLAVSLAGTVAAASCVRISGGVFDAPGNDNYMPQLNGEYIKIHNYCSTTKYLTGWRLNDYGNKHVYAFPSGVKIYAYKTITVYSGTGTRTGSKLYWASNGAVWNNTPPERAYLRNSAGTLVSSWSLY